MIRAVIFDLDGTLIDSLRGIADSLNRTLAAHGLPGHADAQVRGFIGDGLRNLILRALPAGTGPHVFESIHDLYRKDYARTWKSGSEPYPGIRDLLATLTGQGIPIAVLSNKVHDFTVEMVREIFPEIPFHPVLGQRDSIPQKPDPVAALEIAREIGVAPEKCLFVGDSTVDWMTAQNARMHAIGVDWGYHDRDALVAAGATCIVSSAGEIFGRIEESIRSEHSNG